MESCRFLSLSIMLTVLHIHFFPELWKEVVEKAVENVEKCEFSTGIPVCFTARRVVEKIAYTSA